MIFDTANLGYWVLLGTGVLLFLFVIFSGGGDDDLDADIDADVDIDVDVDVDVDVDADIDADIDVDADIDADVDGDIDGDVEANGNFGILSILSWFGFGQAPLMILLAIDCSLWGLLGWIFNVWIAVGIGEIPTGLLGIGVFWVSGAIALWTGKLLAYPLGKIFASFGEDVSSERLVGCEGTVSSKILPSYIDGKVGQVDVYDAARNMVTVNASSPPWASIMPTRGQKILIIEHREHSYLAIVKGSSDEDKWLRESSS
ncbi:hypothetical protein Lepto7376_1399 [[Leptolyngbya] sp. PCC 7376]|uniref:OB-fold-containig protein n=1 Tax=[Leptolyngbya] sp. PCC 7376 TaxID=111781 RepID=UPI00029ECBCD|nr:OB-fold-containig protein [[Leptolyngbya] sp. PCC 7376]AFY37748.1 hypothetical protein Lepto7376_1399 [[Leptolyngbya] sp. PCC 7376]